MSLKSWYKNKINAKVCDYVRSRYAMADVTPVQGLFNYKCFHNAAEYARVYEGVSVVEAIYINNGLPVLHYLNKDNGTGELFETTLGYRAESLEYYIIRDVDDSDHKYMESEFDRSLRSWLVQFTNIFERIVFRIDRVV